MGGWHPGHTSRHAPPPVGAISHSLHSFQVAWRANEGSGAGSIAKGGPTTCQPASRRWLLTSRRPATLLPSHHQPSLGPGTWPSQLGGAGAPPGRRLRTYVVPEGNPCDLKLLLLNAKSLNNKICLIQNLILDENADMVYITDAWLETAGGVNLSQLCPPDFQVLQQPWLQEWGGNVALIFWDYISLSGCPIQQCAGCECLHVMVQGRDRLDSLLVYHSPCGPSLFMLRPLRHQ